MAEAPGIAQLARASLSSATSRRRWAIISALRLVRRPPVVDEALARALDVGAATIRSRARVGVRRTARRSPPRSARARRGPMLALAPDLAQLERRDALGEREERAAGLDLRQLAVVADEHELCLARAQRSSSRRGHGCRPCPASSTTSTEPCGAVSPARSARASRAIVVASMAAWSRSSQAARADSAQPMTGCRCAATPRAAASSARSCRCRRRPNDLTRRARQ